MVENADKKTDEDDMKMLTDAYRMQELDKMDELTKKEDMGMQNFTDMLLYNRNANWAKKLEGLMAKNSLVVAVGAGHLPGDKGVISLLRKAGYKVEPVKNDMIKKKSKEI
ncbi:MAG TPA: TraB/GumN family protein [Flavisolibacter sp.]|nr:TraB/GumN family protein [Flavisolibacter sp.]